MGVDRRSCSSAGGPGTTVETEEEKGGPSAPGSAEPSLIVADQSARKGRRHVVRVCAGLSLGERIGYKDTWRDRRQVARASASSPFAFTRKPMAFLISLPWLALHHNRRIYCWPLVLHHAVAESTRRRRGRGEAAPLFSARRPWPCERAIGRARRARARCIIWRPAVSASTFSSATRASCARVTSTAAGNLTSSFSGAVTVTTREKGRDVTRRYSDGDLVVIPANVPHIFRFLNRTVRAYASRAR